MKHIPAVAQPRVSSTSLLCALPLCALPLYTLPLCTSRLRTSTLQAAWFALRQCHRQEVSDVETRLAASGLSAEQMLAVAQRNGIGLREAINLVVPVPKLLAELQTLDASTPPASEVRSASAHAGQRASALERLKGHAVSHAQARRSAPAALALPQGVAQPPPERPAGYTLTSLPRAVVVHALETFETNSNPVSSPAYAAAADPLFATWLKALDGLGTRTLTMAEMQALVVSDVASVGLLDRDGFKLIYDPAKGLGSDHELHKFTAGFRGHPGAMSYLMSAGQGGESGIQARVTDEFEYDIPDNWGDEAAILDHMSGELRKIAKDVKNPTFWTDAESALASGSPEEVRSKLNSFASGYGFFADPRQQQLLRPTVQALLGTPAGSAARRDAAKLLIDNFRERAQRLEVVSVSGATAEIQMVQTLYRYLKQHGLSVSNPTQKIDAVEVYRLYKNLLDSGELTSRATVEAWLKTSNVPHVP